MKKMLVETSGAFELTDLYAKSRQIIDAVRPSVVEATPFVQGRLALGQLKLLAPELKPEATDEEFQKYWDETASVEDGIDEATGETVKVTTYDSEFAVESFLTAFNLVAPTEKKTKGKNKEAA